MPNCMMAGVSGSMKHLEQEIHLDPEIYSTPSGPAMAVLVKIQMGGILFRAAMTTCKHERPVIQQGFPAGQWKVEQYVSDAWEEP